MSTVKALENAIQTGDVSEVRAILHSNPDLVHRRLRKNLTESGSRENDGAS